MQRCHLRGRDAKRRREHQETYGIELERRSRGAVGDELSDKAEAIKRLLPQLPQRQYEVTVLRHLQGMSFEQIGEVLGIAPATARVHAKAAREALRDMVAKGLGDHAVGPTSREGGS